MSAWTGAPAQAATLHAQGDGDMEFSDYFSFRYSGTPGETNRVWANWNPATGTLTIDDTGALAILPLPKYYGDPFEVVDWCTYERQRVVCQIPDTPRDQRIDLSFDLADGNDFLQLGVDGAKVHVMGGDGNDRLLQTGSAGVELLGDAGNDTLTGGAGSDVLTGGAGSDRVEGAGGDDLLRLHDGAADRYGCGLGTDAAFVDALDALLSAADCERTETGA